MQSHSSSSVLENAPVGDGLAQSEAVEGEALSTPAQIDGRRAQQLSERAASLAARGDMAAAILATRQSLALAPHNAEGHAVLGGLLERANDYTGARAAYEKSLQIAPERADFGAKLAALSARLEQSQGVAQQFHFNEAELYPNAEPGDAPVTDALRAASTDAADDEADALLDIDPELALSYAAPEVVTEAAPVIAPAVISQIEARLPPSRTEVEALEAAQSVVGAPAIDVAPAPSTEAESSVAGASQAEVAAPSGSAAPTILDSDPVTERRLADRRQVSVPVGTERRQLPTRRASNVVGAVPISTGPVATVASASVLAAPTVAPANVPANAKAGVPLTIDLPVPAPTPVWRRIAERPSFYARTLPLVGVALLGLGFLGWARGRAVSQVVAPVAVAPAPSESQELAAMPDQSQPNAAPGTAVVVPADTNNPGGNNDGGFPISNVPIAPAPATGNAPVSAKASASGNANGAAPARNANAAGGGATRANRPAPRIARAVPRPVPNFPAPLAPAPIPPASPAARANQSGGGNIILPRPQIDLPAPQAPPTRVLPSDSGLNPAGSPNRNYVRVTEGRVGNGIIPAQPEAVARQNEQSASEAARNGQTDQAINQLSEAIRADSENAGFRYQQRASLFLQRGDYARARDDFQSAISAYQNQIARGENVAAARRGLNSARSGLNVALAAQG